jgi:hypothetical protein
LQAVAAVSDANFGIKELKQVTDSSAALNLMFHREPAAIPVGTSNSPHWLKAAENGVIRRCEG